MRSSFMKQASRVHRITCSSSAMKDNMGSFSWKISNNSQIFLIRLQTYRYWVFLWSEGPSKLLEGHWKSWSLGICDLDHLNIDVHQYPLPSILSRTTGHINYSKWLCSSHNCRSNQDVSTSFNSISGSMDFILPSLSTQIFKAHSDISKFPDFSLTFYEFAKFPDPFPWLFRDF